MVVIARTEFVDWLVSVLSVQFHVFHHGCVNWIARSPLSCEGFIKFDNVRVRTSTVTLTPLRYYRAITTIS